MDANTPDTRPSAPEPKGIGALIGSIILIAILIVGGMYFFFGRMRMNTARESKPIAAPHPAAPSTAVIDPALEADIHQVDAELESFETELGDLEADFQ